MDDQQVINIPLVDEALAIRRQKCYAIRRLLLERCEHNEWKLEEIGESPTQLRKMADDIGHPIGESNDEEYALLVASASSADFLESILFLAKYNKGRLPASSFVKQCHKHYWYFDRTEREAFNQLLREKEADIKKGPLRATVKDLMSSIRPDVKDEERKRFPVKVEINPTQLPSIPTIAVFKNKKDATVFEEKHGLEETDCCINDDSGRFAYLTGLPDGFQYETSKIKMYKIQELIRLVQNELVLLNRRKTQTIPNALNALNVNDVVVEEGPMIVNQQNIEQEDSGDVLFDDYCVEEEPPIGNGQEIEKDEDGDDGRGVKRVNALEDEAGVAKKAKLNEVLEEENEEGKENEEEGERNANEVEKEKYGEKNEQEIVVPDGSSERNIPVVSGVVESHEEE